MKIQILTIFLLAFFSCKNVTENETEQVQIIADSTEIKIEKVEKPTKNTNLISLLENPIDLQGYKSLKAANQVTTSVTNGTDYYFNPEIKDSVFYVYYYPMEHFTDPKKIDRIVVLKYGENKHSYEDKTETLIEFSIFNKDSDLGKANLIGLSKTELEAEFGNDYLTIDSGIVYSNKNKVLILELNNSQVISYRYIKLNTEKIDMDLIEQIIK